MSISRKPPDYFDAPAETKPLLHTWSLGVEEQFYFVAPLLMLLAYRVLPKRAKLLFAIVAALSFAGRAGGEHAKPDLCILSHAVSRLGAGAGRAAGDRVHPGAGNPFWKNLCGVAGLLLLLGIILLGSPSAPLLVMTSLAGIGATLVIASSERGISPVGRLLSLRPFVFIGLISYSLYLWHWPLIVFQRTDALFCRGIARDRPG